MSEDDELTPSNTRRFRQESDRKYLYLVLFTLVVVGGLLIAIIFGPESLLTALPCLLGGAALILLPWAVLTLIQKSAPEQAQFITGPYFQHGPNFAFGWFEEDKLVGGIRYCLQEIGIDRYAPYLLVRSV